MGKAGSNSRGADERNQLTLVASIDSKVTPVDRNDAVSRMELAHTHQTEICQVRIAVGVAVRQSLELLQVLTAIERKDDEPLTKQLQSESDVLQVKRRLGENCFAGQKRARHTLGEDDRPFMVPVVSVGKSDQEPGVGDPLHFREKPLREERSLGPRTLPARRMKACPDDAAFERSN